jgi:hypothetical protein
MQSEVEVEVESEVEDEQPMLSIGSRATTSPDIWEVPQDENEDLPAHLGEHMIQFHGCEVGTHATNKTLHFQNPNRRTNHHSLSDLEPILGTVPDVLSQPKMLKHKDIHNHVLPDWERVFDGKHELANVEEEAQAEERVHVCLHKSEQPNQRTQIKYDIDSHLGYVNSLAFAKQGLMINFAPIFSKHIQTNLHIYTDVFYDTDHGPKPMKVKLQKVPHICLGYMFGQQHTEVFLFFPAQWSPDKATNFPGKENGNKHQIIQRFIDTILLPCIRRFVDSDIAQHMPISWQQARLNSEARFQEASAVKDNPISHQQQLHYPLQREVLSPIWDSIERELKRPRNAIYKGAFLFFSNKNTKSVYKAGTVAKMWEKFEAQMEFNFDSNYFDDERVYIDLGKETICTNWSLPNEPVFVDNEPSTYLMRECCLNSFYKWCHFGESEKKMKQSVFIPAMLAESHDMLLEMGKDSSKRMAGWLFTQVYNSYKELTDVAKTKPLRSPHITQFAWDPKVHSTIQKEGKARSAERRQIRRGWRQGKKRLYSALREGETKSAGVREEHRISLTFFYQMMGYLKRAGKWEQQGVIPAERPYWELSSKVFNTFVASNVNKFMFAFEYILAWEKNGYVSYEHSKVLRMFLDCAKFCYDTAPLNQEPGLWKDRYQLEANEPFIQGMGMEQTIQESGYGWLLPKVDWELMTFQLGLSNEMRYTDLAMHDNYRKQWAGVKDIKDDMKMLDLIGTWLSLYHSNAEMLELLLLVACSLIVRHFRKDVFRSIKDEIRPEFCEAALNGSIMLCKRSLKKVLLPNDDKEKSLVYTISANRSKVKTIQQLVDLLWDFDDGIPRTSWNNRGFRGIHRRALDVVKKSSGKVVAGHLHDRVKRLFITSNWIIPYPSKDKFLQRGGPHGKDRLWISVYHREWAYEYKLGASISFSQLCETTGDVRPSIKYEWRRPQLELERSRKEEFLVEYGKDGSVLLPVEYMGAWGLVEESTGSDMDCIPADGPVLVNKGDNRIEAFEQELSRLWEESVDNT